MSNGLKLLLSAHYKLRSRHHADIDAQLAELSQGIEAECAELAQQERIRVFAEAEVVQEVLILLQHDARPLSTLR